MHHDEVATDDLNAFLPLAHLNDAAEQGRIGKLGSRFYGIRTTFSQRQSVQEDAPAVLDMVCQDRVDAVVLIPL